MGLLSLVVEKMGMVGALPIWEKHEVWLWLLHPGGGASFWPWQMTSFILMITSMSLNGPGRIEGARGGC